jgi:hypothetical protein
MTSLEGWSSTIELRPRRRLGSGRLFTPERTVSRSATPAQTPSAPRRAGDELDTALLVRQRHTRDGIVNHEADREETSSQCPNKRR